MFRQITLSNAVYHRAYDERELIEVRIENDRIEIVSFPGPDRSVTIEGLKNYRVSNRRYRNRRIGDFLKELHLTEGRNTGFKKIFDALEANGSPKPEFETDDARSYFISRIYIQEEFLKKDDEEESILVTSTPKSTPSAPKLSQSTPTATPKTPTSTPNSTSSDLMADDIRALGLRGQILWLIKKNPSITKKKMAEMLGVSMYALKKELALMNEEHVAEFVGYSRNGKWVVY